MLTAVILISFVNIANANALEFKNSEKIETRYLKGNLAEAAIRAKLAAEGADSNTIVINVYFTMNYVRDTVSNTAKITYQSTPVVTVLDIGGTGQAFDLQY